MGKFAEADSRLFKNMFVCKRCKAKIRAPMLKVLGGRISCRNCNTKQLRPKKKK